MSQNLIIIVEGAYKYSFNDKQSGRLVEGITVYYMQEKNQENSVGRIPQKISISDVGQWQNISALKFPCTAEIISEQALGSKGVYTKVVGVRAVQK
jgi:hypothetical protein